MTTIENNNARGRHGDLARLARRERFYATHGPKAPLSLSNALRNGMQGTLHHRQASVPTTRRTVCRLKDNRGGILIALAQQYRWALQAVTDGDTENWHPSMLVSLPTFR